MVAQMVAQIIAQIPCCPTCSLVIGWFSICNHFFVLKYLIFTATLLRISTKSGNEDYTEHEVTSYSLVLNDVGHMNPQNFSRKLLIIKKYSPLQPFLLYTHTSK